MAAVEQPAVSTTGNKETVLASNGLDHNINAAQNLKQRMSVVGSPGPEPGPGPNGPTPPNGSSSGPPHESNGGYPGHGQYPGYYPGYPGHPPPPHKGAPGPPGGPYPGAPAPGGPTPTLNSLLQDNRGQRYPPPGQGYEGGPPPPGGPGGPPPQGYPGWGYQGHPQYRGQVGQHS